MSYVNAFQSLNEFGEARSRSRLGRWRWRRSVFDKFCPKEFQQLQPRARTRLYGLAVPILSSTLNGASSAAREIVIVESIVVALVWYRLTAL